MRTDSIEVMPLSAALGAEIRGVDLSRDLDQEAFRRLEDAWHQHLVIVLRNQTIDAAQQVRYGSRFGELSHVKIPRLAGEHPAIMYISNEKQDGEFIHALPVGEMQFHIDQCYTERPAKATILYAMVVPKVGGDTLFSNLYAAYDCLPAGVKRRIAGRKALNVYDYDNASTARAGAVAADAPKFWHPVVRMHPATKRKGLFVNRLMTHAIEGLEKAESDELLAMLFDEIEQPQHVYAHAWRVGDVLMWDNRCTAHARIDFDPAEPRRMRRLTVLGEVPA